MAPNRWGALIVVPVLFLSLSIGAALAQDVTEEPTAEVTEAPTEATPEQTAPPPAPTEIAFTVYTVQVGDTLARIAQRFGVSIETIAQDNGITNPNTIFLGQQLRIRPAGAPTPTAIPVTPTIPPATLPPGTTTTTYTVQRNDTLARIALRFNTTINTLLSLNNLSNPNLIFAGQVLTVPAPGAPAPTVPAPNATVEVEATAVAVADADFAYGVEAFITSQSADEVTNLIQELGVEWVKVNVDWRVFEPTQGQINFPELDVIMNALENAELKVMFTVSTTPDWARTSTDESGPPDDFNTFAGFVGTLAQRYAGRVEAYEIWDEPNLRREWNSNVHPISPTSYLGLLRSAYAAIKAVDPAATVVSAGLAPTGFNDGINAINDRIYLEGLYANGLADVSDAVGAHPNGWANPPDALCCNAAIGVATHYEDPSFYFLETLNDYRDAMLRYNDAGTELWVTDFGWGTSEDIEAPGAIYVFVTYTSLSEQAIYTPRAFEIGDELGFVGPMFAHNLNGCLLQPAIAELCYGSLLGPNGTPRPVFSAVAAIDKTQVEATVEATPEATAPLLAVPVEQPVAQPTESAPPAPATTPEAANG